MKPLFIFAPLMGSLLSLQIAAGAELTPKAGETVPFPIGDMVDTAQLYTPQSWTPSSGRQWPVFLYYHGTGGSPSLNLAKQYAGTDAYFLVGMGYSIAGPISAADNLRYHETEAANLRAVRDALAIHGANPRRIYVGGFSKGGWIASHFADNEPKLIAGAVIMGAGKNPWRQEDLPRYRDKMPIYLGVGTTEVNYQLGYTGIDHWKKRGANVTFDPYLGIGHVPPTRHRSEYLHQWFTIESYRDRKTLLKPIFQHWHDATRAAAKAQTATDPVRAYLLLEHMAAAPLAAFLNSAQRKALSTDIATLRETKAVKAELSQRSAYKRILDKEVLGGFRLRVWIDVIDDYVRIFQAAPKTATGKRAIADAARLLQSMRTSVRSEKRPMVQSFLTTHAALVHTIETAPIDDLNSELRALGEFLNRER